MRRVFYWGIVFSLLVHLIIGAIFTNYRPPRFERNEREIIVAHLTRTVIQTASPTPSPAPRPLATLTPRPHQSVSIVHEKPAESQRLKLNVPRATAIKPKTPVERRYVPPPSGSESGIPNGSGRGRASGGAGAGAGSGGGGGACANARIAAHVLNAVSPDYPDSAAQQHAYGTVLVAVTLSESGAVLSTAIAQSSGTQSLDAAAVRAAQQTQYAPDMVNCKPVGGTYIFRAIFEPDQ